MKRTSATILSLGLLLCASLAAAADPKYTLRYWSFLDPASSDPRSVAQTQMIAAFARENPEVAVKVEIVHWSKMVPLLISAAGAGQAPDVVLVHSTRIPDAADSGSIIPIDSYAAALPRADLEDFLLPLDKTRYNGKLYSIAAEHRIEGMLLYRKDLLEKAGLRAPPKTWGELAQAAKKIARPPVWGFVWALSRKDAAADMKMLQPLYWSLGSDFYGADGGASVNNAHGVEIARAISGIAFDDKAMPTHAVGVEEARSMMKGGTAAMLIEGTQIYQSMRASKTVGSEIVTAPMPAMTVAAYPPPAFLTGQTLAISKDAKDPALAWRFIKFMTGTEAQLISSKVGLNMPVRKSIFSDPWFGAGEGKVITEWKDYAAARGRPPASNPLADFMGDSLGLAYEEILTTRKDHKAALDQAAARYNERRTRN